MDEEDTGKALNWENEPIELEQQHGTMIDRLDQPLILYPDRKRLIARNTKETRAGFFCMLLLLVGVLIVDAHLWYLPVSFILLDALLTIAVFRQHHKRIQPVLEIRENGLTIKATNANIIIPWDEVKEAKTCKLFWSIVSIVPVDLKKTAARGSAWTKINIALATIMLPIDKLLGVSTTPIVINDMELPLDVETVAEQINLRKAHYQKQNSLPEISDKS